LAIVLLIIELANGRSYFVFPDVKVVLNDLYAMEPKVLSAVELDAINGASANTTDA
jgi:hypothetical protein